MRRSVPTNSLGIICASLSNSSVKQYSVAFKRWFSFCDTHNIDYYEASIPNIIYFLTEIFNSGAQYGTLNSYRSALSLIIGSRVASDDRINRLFKGFYRLRPSLPKYKLTWDTSIVLDFLANLYPNRELPLEQLTKKTVTLLALTTGHRVQTLSLIKTPQIQRYTNGIRIKIPDMIKTSRPGAHQPCLNIPFYETKPEICPAGTLLNYLDVTLSLRTNNEYLFISYRRPYNSVTSQTLSKWIKNTLNESGIDTSIFSAHSTRHASTSAASRLGVSIDVIRNTAGWSGSSNVFGKFYNKNIVDNSNDFALSILGNNSNLI